MSYQENDNYFWVYTHFIAFVFCTFRVKWLFFIKLMQMLDVSALGYRFNKCYTLYLQDSYGIPTSTRINIANYN